MTYFSHERTRLKVLPRMKKHVAELREIAKKLKAEAEKLSDLAPSISAIDKAANQVGQSFSGSWTGYHSRVYYQDFQSPPRGAVFKPEWGLVLNKSMVRATAGLSGSIGDWQEYSSDVTGNKIFELARSVELDIKSCQQAINAFNTAKLEIASILAVQQLHHWDSNLTSLEKAIDLLRMKDAETIASQEVPSGIFVCRDQKALAEGPQIPQHVMIKARMAAINQCFTLCGDLSKLVESLAAHIDRIGDAAEKKVGNNVFIGHGGSSAWRDLKDLLKDRLHLPVEEFNSSSAAGLSTVERLTEMLNASTFAFLGA